MMTMIELQDKFASQIALSIESPWDSILVHYENMTLNGENNEIFTAFYIFDGTKHDFSPDLELLDILLDLKKHQPLNQAEKWTWLEFEIDQLGKYKFDYKYGMPPHLATQLKHSSE